MFKRDNDNKSGKRYRKWSKIFGGEQKREEENQEISSGLEVLEDLIRVVNNMINKNFSNSGIEDGIKIVVDEFCSYIDKYFKDETLAKIMSLIISGVKNGKVSREFGKKMLMQINQTYRNKYNKDFNDYSKYDEALLNANVEGAGKNKQPE